MVQFKVLSGRKAGATTVARRFPVRIGRAPGADLSLDDDGIWEQHVRVEFEPDRGFVAIPEPGALLAINGEQVQEKVLRNGDIIDVGGAKLQFWLAEARQAALSLREWLVWIGVAIVCVIQVALIYLLKG